MNAEAAAPPCVLRVSRASGDEAGGSPRTLEDLLRRHLTGRFEPREINALMDELAAGGRGRLLTDAYRVVDAPEFHAQLEMLRAGDDEQLLSTQLPDHWLGNY